MSFHLLIRWCASQLQYFGASASGKLSSGPSSSYSSWIFFRNVRPGAGRDWYYIYGHLKVVSECILHFPIYVCLGGALVWSQSAETIDQLQAISLASSLYLDVP